MTTTFEDRLLSELKREVTLAAAEDRRAQREREPKRRRVFTPARAGIGLAAAAVAGATVIVLPGGTATSAYAVEPTGKGGLKVTLSDWPQGEEELREFADLLESHRVHVVVQPPAGWECQPFEPPEDAMLWRWGSDEDGSGPMAVEGGVSKIVQPDPHQEEVVEFHWQFHLHQGDSVVLTEDEEFASMRLYNGACAPLPDDGE